MTNSLRTADAFPVYFSKGEKRRPEMRLLFAGYIYKVLLKKFYSLYGNSMGTLR